MHSALFIDIDGTLLEIAARPENVQVPRQLPALLDRLARQRGGALALVSGRPLADIDRLFAPLHGAAAGVHGAERRRGDGRLVPTSVDPAAAQALDRLRAKLTRLVFALPGVRLEDKGATLALHFRDAPQHAVEVGEAAAALAREAGDCLRLVPGKMVVELLPRWCNKGGAIAAFLGEPPFAGRPAVVLGDDTTDEDGFLEVNRRGGVSIRVGPPSGTTAARYVLESVAAARVWLGAEPT